MYSTMAVSKADRIEKASRWGNVNSRLLCSEDKARLPKVQEINTTYQSHRHFGYCHWSCTHFPIAEAL